MHHLQNSFFTPSEMLTFTVSIFKFSPRLIARIWMNKYMTLLNTPNIYKGEEKKLQKEFVKRKMTQTCPGLKNEEFQYQYEMIHLR